MARKEMTALAIDLSVTGRIDDASRATIDRLAHAIQHQHGRCDAVGECGLRCALRAEHPGEIHEVFSFGRGKRFRLTGEAWTIERS